MGRSVYLTEKEQSALRDTASEWCSMLDDSADLVSERLDNGLGSALRKLYKGRVGERTYKHYRFKREED